MRLSHALATVALGGAFVLAGCDAVAPEASSPDVAAASADARAADSYIVVFKDGTGNARALANRIGGNGVTHVYENTIRGFAFRGSAQAAAALERNPNVAYVESDKVATMGPPCGTPNGGPCDGGGGGGGGGSESTPYGITRVNGGVSGAGLVACVLDSGVDLDHPDLNVDVANSRTFITKGKDSRDADDRNGHGTHVAGTIGAIGGNGQGVIGVAEGATIIAIKVLDGSGSGSYSGVIAGVDYAATAGCSVANMSLGGPVSQALDDAVLAASQNVIFALAAGNESDDSRNHSPARAGSVSSNDNVYAISAINSSDVFASFSNFGPGVEYAAPGVAVESTWKSGGYNTISGTSMASPHAAGVFLLGSARTSGTAINDPDGNPDPIIVH